MLNVFDEIARWAQQSPAVPLKNPGTDLWMRIPFKRSWGSNMTAMEAFSCILPGRGDYFAACLALAASTISSCTLAGTRR